MRVIVAGGRDFNDYELVKLILDSRKERITEVVSGACRLKSNFDNEHYASGVDGLGEKWADENGIPYKRFFANDYGEWPGCGPRRNEAMAQYAEALVAFPGGRGTRNMITLAARYGLKLLLIP